jgi:hypothetical protein
MNVSTTASAAPVLLFVGVATPGTAVEHFMMKVVGMPPEFGARARTELWWSAQEALAHTLAYDATIMRDYSLPTERTPTQEGRGHNVDPAVLALALVEFFEIRRAPRRDT